MEVEQSGRTTSHVAWALDSALFVFTQSILRCRLNTLGALYQAIWTRWEHSTKLFDHAGSTLLHEVWFTLTESTTVYPAFYARVWHTRAFWVRLDHSLVHAEPQKEHSPWDGQSEARTAKAWQWWCSGGTWRSLPCPCGKSRCWGCAVARVRRCRVGRRSLRWEAQRPREGGERCLYAPRTSPEKKERKMFTTKVNKGKLEGFLACCFTR